MITFIPQRVYIAVLIQLILHSELGLYLVTTCVLLLCFDPGFWQLRAVEEGVAPHQAQHHGPGVERRVDGPQGDVRNTR